MESRPVKQLPSDRQRRIGERHQLAIDVSWCPSPVSRWKRRVKPMQVTSDNLSVSGLGFVSETVPSVQIGTLVDLTIGETSGHAVIRMVKPTSAPGQSYYGLEFRDANLENQARLLVSDVVEAEGKPRTVAVAGQATAPYQPDHSMWT